MKSCGLTASETSLVASTAQVMGRLTALLRQVGLLSITMSSVAPAVGWTCAENVPSACVVAIGIGVLELGSPSRSGTSGRATGVVYGEPVTTPVTVPEMVVPVSPYCNVAGFAVTVMVGV